MNAQRSENGPEYHSNEAMPPAAAKPSRRQRSRWRQWCDKRLPELARLWVNLLWKTCRVEITTDPLTEALLDGDTPVIPCYWHGQQIFCVHALLEHRRRRPTWQLGYLISPSRDGDAAARVFEDLDLRVIRGSASRGGAQALREIYQAIRRDGISPVVTPDGPRGPNEVFKSGVAMLASLSGAPLIPLACAARPGVQLSSWDRTRLPLPFARVAVRVGAPLSVARGLDGDALDTVCEDAAAMLGRLRDQAQSDLLR